MTNEEKKYEEALTKAAKEYQERIETNNPQAEGWDFYNAFISGATWRDKQSIKEKESLINKACEWLQKHINDYLVKGRDIDYMFDDFLEVMKGEIL